MNIQVAMYEKLVRLMVEQDWMNGRVRRLARRMPIAEVKRASREAGSRYLKELQEKAQKSLDSQG